MYQDGAIDFCELAKAVERSIKEKKRREVSVSLPMEFVESKIVNIKNKKLTEIPKLIEKEYSSFGRVSPLTHVLDYAYLGQKEENGDTLHYYMIAAVHKNVVSQLAAEFEKRKLKITTVTFPYYDMICLSELYYIELCENNEVEITKIIYGGSVINGFDKRLKQLEVETEKFDIDMCGEKDGKNFLLWIDEVSVGSAFFNALGLSVNTMF